MLIERLGKRYIGRKLFIFWVSEPGIAKSRQPPLRPYLIPIIGSQISTSGDVMLNIYLGGSHDVAGDDNRIMSSIAFNKRGHSSSIFHSCLPEHTCPLLIQFFLKSFSY